MGDGVVRGGGVNAFVWNLAQYRETRITKCIAHNNCKK